MSHETQDFAILHNVYTINFRVILFFNFNFFKLTMEVYYDLDIKYLISITYFLNEFDRNILGSFGPVKIAFKLIHLKLFSILMFRNSSLAKF